MKFDSNCLRKIAYKYMVSFGFYGCLKNLQLNIIISDLLAGLLCLCALQQLLIMIYELISNNFFTMGSTTVRNWNLCKNKNLTAKYFFFTVRQISSSMQTTKQFMLASNFVALSTVNHFYTFKKFLNCLAVFHIF